MFSEFFAVEEPVVGGYTDWGCSYDLVASDEFGCVVTGFKNRYR